MSLLQAIDHLNEDIELLTVVDNELAQTKQRVHKAIQESSQITSPNLKFTDTSRPGDVKGSNLYESCYHDHFLRNSLLTMLSEVTEIDSFFYILDYYIYLYHETTPFKKYNTYIPNFIKLNLTLEYYVKYSLDHEICFDYYDNNNILCSPLYYLIPNCNYTDYNKWEEYIDKYIDMLILPIMDVKRSNDRYSIYNILILFNVLSYHDSTLIEQQQNQNTLQGVKYNVTSINNQQQFPSNACYNFLYGYIASHMEVSETEYAADGLEQLPLPDPQKDINGLYTILDDYLSLSTLYNIPFNPILLSNLIQFQIRLYTMDDDYDDISLYDNITFIINKVLGLIYNPSIIYLLLPYINDDDDNINFYQVFLDGISSYKSYIKQYNINIIDLLFDIHRRVVYKSYSKLHNMNHSGNDENDAIKLFYTYYNDKLCNLLHEDECGILFDACIYVQDTNVIKNMIDKKVNVQEYGTNFILSAVQNTNSLNVLKLLVEYKANSNVLPSSPVSSYVNFTDLDIFTYTKLDSLDIIDFIIDTNISKIQPSLLHYCAISPCPNILQYCSEKYNLDIVTYRYQDQTLLHTLVSHDCINDTNIKYLKQFITNNHNKKSKNSHDNNDNDQRNSNHDDSYYIMLWDNNDVSNSKLISHTSGDSNHHGMPYPPNKQPLIQGIDVNTPDIHGETPLFAALQSNSPKMIKLLLDMKADVHHISNAGRPLLYKFYRLGPAYSDTIYPSLKILLEAHADINCVCREGYSIMIHIMSLYRSYNMINIKELEYIYNYMINIYGFIKQYEDYIVDCCDNYRYIFPVPHQHVWWYILERGGIFNTCHRYDQLLQMSKTYINLLIDMHGDYSIINIDKHTQKYSDFERKYYGNNDEYIL